MEVKKLSVGMFLPFPKPISLLHCLPVTVLVSKWQNGPCVLSLPKYVWCSIQQVLSINIRSKTELDTKFIRFASYLLDTGFWWEELLNNSYIRTSFVVSDFFSCRHVFLVSFLSKCRNRKNFWNLFQHMVSLKMHSPSQLTKFSPFPPCAPQI